MMEAVPLPGQEPIVVEHDPHWADEFEEIAARLATAFGSLANNVHHVGSTSISGMKAKPILDIIIELAPGVQISAATQVLTPLGYEHEGEKGIPGRHAYRNTSPAVPFSTLRIVWMHHHLYVCAQGSAELDRMLRFRDRLRNSESLRQEYMQIKDEALRLANGVRRVYVDEKARLGGAFFQRVIDS